MLAKGQRLSREQFAHHFNHGKRFHSPYGTVVVSPFSTFHGAVVVSKKVSKRAVVRNTLRRRAYAQLYTIAKEQHPAVFIMLLKPTMLTLSRVQQHAALKELIERGVKSTYNSQHV